MPSDIYHVAQPTFSFWKTGWPRGQSRIPAGGGHCCVLTRWPWSLCPDHIPLTKHILGWLLEGSGPEGHKGIPSMWSPGLLLPRPEWARNGNPVWPHAWGHLSLQTSHAWVCVCGLHLQCPQGPWPSVGYLSFLWEFLVHILCTALSRWWFFIISQIS